MEELLNEIDELLAHFEDFTHGKDGEDITKMRGKIALALRQYNVSDSLPHIKIEINGKKVEIKSTIEHDDVVMFWLIESIYALRNKQYSDFRRQ